MIEFHAYFCVGEDPAGEKRPILRRPGLRT